LFSLKENSQPDISTFETVIIGGSIYAGQVSKKIKTFCKENETLLLQKKIGLFISGMEPDKESQEKELKAAFPEVLLKKSEIASFLGGEFLFEKMNLFFRMIAQKIAKTKENVEQIDKERIEEFAKKFQ
jgi:menaquinone-dependent protoporphyrinogen oxidase